MVLTKVIGTQFGSRRPAKFRLRAIACPPTPNWFRLGDTADGIDDPSPERANSAVARLFSTGHQINGLSVTGLDIERRHQLPAKSRSCLDQGRPGARLRG